MINPYEQLANAIIMQACADYVYAEDNRSRYEVERFFHSRWFGALTTADPDYLLRMLKNNKAKIKRHI